MQDLKPVRVVTASAGTGKTHRLTTEIRDAVFGGTSASAVLATTFTTRAAAELVSRARAMLVEAGKRRDAEGLLGGRFGTVNSVFGALLREFALEGGRSPIAEVIPEERAQTLFRIAADKAIGEYADQLQAVAERFGYVEGGGREVSWRDFVAQIVSLSRANGIAPESLEESRDRSWRALQELLEPTRQGETEEVLDHALKRAVYEALQAVAGGDGTKTTQTAAQRLREANELLSVGRRLTWQHWAQLTKIKAAKASDLFFDQVRSAAAAHPRHPRLRKDIEFLIRGVFGCAANALVAYRDYKLTRGLVDFADQEAEALVLLDRPDVASVLAERLDVALVDEFQDTSPIQLALFLRIARIVRRSFWVGDPKQSIYGFRGSDPDLMSAAARHIVKGSAGSGETLATSYRARPGLLGFFNDLFVPAFGHQGILKQQAECSEAARADAAGQGAPLAVWYLTGSNKEKRAAALAAGVRRMLQGATSWTFVPKGETAARPVRPGDIAILCRTRASCRAVAEALESADLQVAMSRGGLLQSAECVLALACLRWLADTSDTLALAEIAHLMAGHSESGQPEWFEKAVGQADGIARMQADYVPLAVEALRPSLLSMTPLEVLDATIAAAGIVGLITKWGSSVQRFVNLDALRSLAADYEDDCRQSRQPATLGGLVAWLEESGADKPESNDAHAVAVSTYHGAKGLEWPVTILGDLDFAGGARLFDQVVAEGAEGNIDLSNPLKDRWLRFWPWPYGAQSKDVGLDGRVAQSAIGQAASIRAAHEDVRLLYVAMTRARDYLVLAVDHPKNEPKASALEGLVDEAGSPSVKLPKSDADPILVGGAQHNCSLWILDEAAGATSGAAPAIPTYDMATTARATGSVPLPYRLRPSGVVRKGDDKASIGERIVLGPRLALTGSPDMSALGDAIHGFLAADSMVRERTSRAAMAESIMERWGVGGALAPADVVSAADRLWQFCANRWPSARLTREWPVVGRAGLQRVQGRIDLLIETDTSLAIIDHKTYPGRPDTWEERIAGYAPQLNLYGELCAAATGKKVEALWVHLPVSGTLLQVA